MKKQDNEVRATGAAPVLGWLVEKYNNLVIEFQRWNYRRKHKAESKKDIDAQLKAIEKAERLSKERRCRLWVVRLSPGTYRIYSKGDVKAVLRRIGLKGQIDLFSINGSVVHITK
jgi:uncharacterized Fe-S cluster-containing radical SAM superfamily protein